MSLLPPTYRVEGLPFEYLCFRTELVESRWLLSLCPNVEKPHIFDVVCVFADEARLTMEPAQETGG